MLNGPTTLIRSRVFLLRQRGALPFEVRARLEWMGGTVERVEKGEKACGRY